MRLSVVIPVFNRADYIQDCIKSVFNQKNPGCNYEVIVVDDGSTDDTPRILSEFKGKIVYKRIANSGRPAVPRNVGLKLSKGNIVAFQDSDDLWNENKLHEQLKKYNSNYVLSYSNASIMDQDGTSLRRNIINDSQAHSGDVFEYLIKDNFVSTLTVLADKKTIFDLGGFDESRNYLEDYDMWLRMSLRGEFIYVPKVLAKYRVHRNNISSGSEYSDLKKMYKIMNKLQKTEGLEEKKLVSIRRKDIAYRLSDISSGIEKYSWKIKSRIAR